MLRFVALAAIVGLTFASTINEQDEPMTMENSTVVANETSFENSTMAADNATIANSTQDQTSVRRKRQAVDPIISENSTVAENSTETSLENSTIAENATNLESIIGQRRKRQAGLDDLVPAENATAENATTADNLTVSENSTLAANATNDNSTEEMNVRRKRQAELDVMMPAENATASENLTISDNATAENATTSENLTVSENSTVEMATMIVCDESLAANSSLENATLCEVASVESINATGGNDTLEQGQFNNSTSNETSEITIRRKRQAEVDVASNATSNATVESSNSTAVNETATSVNETSTDASEAAQLNITQAVRRKRQSANATVESSAENSVANVTSSTTVEAESAPNNTSRARRHVRSAEDDAVIFDDDYDLSTEVPLSKGDNSTEDENGN